MADTGGEVPYLPLAPPHVPRLTERIAWFREGSRLVLLEDGYPAKLTKAGIVVHPMHGRYILEDLIEQYGTKPTPSLMAAIVRTARSVVGRADPHGSALVMWYEHGAASSMVSSRRYISGLPQAYYAALLARVALLSGDMTFAAEADRFFEPLLTPVGSGGVLHEGPPGPSLAMAPMYPRDWTLNGWLSMLVSAYQFATDRPSLDARALVDANVRTLARVLAAFDAPQQRLSRYTLLGMLTLRLSFSAGVEGVALRNLRIAIPDEPAEVPIPLRDASGWKPRVLMQDAGPGSIEGEIVPTSRSLRMVAMLSRAPHPRPNELRFSIDSPRPIRLGLQAFIGSYAPLKSATVDRQWVDLATTEVGIGTREVRLRLPYDPIDLFSYPTNFARQYAGKHLNTYHGTHIVRLRQLAAVTGNLELRKWERRWRAYVDEWPDIPAYESFGCWTPEGDV